MNARLKIFAAALGLLVAAGTVADASAAPLHRTVVAKTVVTKTVYAGHRHRHFGARILGTRVIGRRIVARPLVETVRVVRPARVRIVHRGFVRHAMFRRPAIVIR